MKKKYDVIYSLGANCRCAIHMQNSYLRNYAGPFDWLSGGDFETRAQLICNDFEGFLDKKYLIQLDGVSGRNDQYYNTSTDLSFVHDFPHGTPFDTSFLQIKEKYERRIARFYNLIQTNNDVLLIWFRYGGLLTEDEKVIKLCDDICKKFNKQISFLIIEEDKNINGGKLISTNLQSNIIRCNFDIIKEPIPIAGVTRRSEILKEYSTKGTTKKRVQLYCAKIFAKALPIFIPVSYYRKKLRHKIRSYITSHNPWKFGG